MEVQDNCIDFYTGDKEASVTFSQQRYVKRIEELAERCPNECKIVSRNDDGSIFAKIPSKWIKINPPRKLNDEQRAKVSERAKKNLHNK